MLACPMQSRCSSSAVQWVSGGPVCQLLMIIQKRVRLQLQLTFALQINNESGVSQWVSQWVSPFPPTSVLQHHHLHYRHLWSNRYILPRSEQRRPWAVQLSDVLFGFLQHVDDDNIEHLGFLFHHQYIYPMTSTKRIDKWNESLLILLLTHYHSFYDLLTYDSLIRLWFSQFSYVAIKTSDPHSFHVLPHTVVRAVVCSATLAFVPAKKTYSLVCAM